MSFSEFPLTACRWFLLANIVLAAWLYGGTRVWTRDWVSWLLLANTLLFVVGLAARRRLPRVPSMVALAAGVLLFQGWFMTWNAKRRFLEAAQIFVDKPQGLPGWPGFVDASMVTPSMRLATGLLGALWMACDLSANRVWRNRLWVTLAATGLSIVILGLAQRLTDAPSIFWDLESNLGSTFFGVFRYHANAGSFLNLVLPLMVGLAVRSFLRDSAERERVFWTLGALVTAAAGFVNVSRAANVLCALLLAGMSAWIAALRMQSAGSKRLATGVAMGAALAGVAVMLALSFGMEKTLSRWEIGFWRLTPADNGRCQAYEIIVKSALPAAGAFGFGPGTFERMFNIHREQTGSSLEGRWDMAHSDALQTPMEWGWAGAAAWAVLLAGGFVQACRIAIREKSPEIQPLAVSCAFSLAGLLLHALVDFPLQIASLQLFTVLIAGLAWGTRKA